MKSTERGTERKRPFDKFVQLAHRGREGRVKMGAIVNLANCSKAKADTEKTHLSVAELANRS